jgi:hypothetical protein
LKAQLRKRDKLLQQEREQTTAGGEKVDTPAEGAGIDRPSAAAAEPPMPMRPPTALTAGPASPTALPTRPHTAAGTAVPPMPTVQRVNAADAAQWRRTDNIIMAVLSRSVLVHGFHPRQ